MPAPVIRIISDLHFGDRASSVGELAWVIGGNPTACWSSTPAPVASHWRPHRRGRCDHLILRAVVARGSEFNPGERIAEFALAPA